jgi:hypothetical protein
MFESNQNMRKGIIDKIILRYKPPCNENEIVEKAPDYIVRPKADLSKMNSQEGKISCPCCGSGMKIDKVLENTTILKCTGCGLSDTRLN